MFTLLRKGQPIGYYAKSEEDIKECKERYIDEHLKAEAGMFQLRLWNETKKSVLDSDAEQIAREMLEETITYGDINHAK
jgi:hypothetical protein